MRRVEVSLGLGEAPEAAVAPPHLDMPRHRVQRRARPGRARRPPSPRAAGPPTGAPGRRRPVCTAGASPTTSRCAAAASARPRSPGRSRGRCPMRSRRHSMASPDPPRRPAWRASQRCDRRQGHRLATAWRRGPLHPRASPCRASARVRRAAVTLRSTARVGRSRRARAAHRWRRRRSGPAHRTHRRSPSPGSAGAAGPWRVVAGRRPRCSAGPVAGPSRPTRARRAGRPRRAPDSRPAPPRRTSPRRPGSTSPRRPAATGLPADEEPVEDVRTATR